MRLKEGVSLVGLRPQMLVALMVAKEVYEDDREVELVVTSGSDSVHSRTSLHYSGAAVDLRTSTLPDYAARRAVRNEIAERLGEDFDVVLESDHLHVEWQPKRRQP